MKWTACRAIWNADTAPIRGKKVPGKNKIAEGCRTHLNFRESPGGEKNNTNPGGEFKRSNGLREREQGRKAPHFY